MGQEARMPKRRNGAAKGPEVIDVSHPAIKYLLRDEHTEQAAIRDSGLGDGWRCGCRKCRPQNWCQAETLIGQRCNMPGRAWERVDGQVLCYRHMQEELSRRNLAALRKERA